MLPVNKEVLSFVRACDAIHVLFGRGDTLTPEEQDIIEASGTELLRKLRPA